LKPQLRQNLKTGEVNTYRKFCGGGARAHACGNHCYLPVAKQAVSYVYHFICTRIRV